MSSTAEQRLFKESDHISSLPLRTNSESSHNQRCQVQHAGARVLNRATWTHGELNPIISIISRDYVPYIGPGTCRSLPYLSLFLVYEMGRCSRRKISPNWRLSWDTSLDRPFSPEKNLPASSTVSLPLSLSLCLPSLSNLSFKATSRGIKNLVASHG